MWKKKKTGLKKKKNWLCAQNCMVKKIIFTIV
ncbi:hypothetical protein RB653_000519 [Dictyostelium firmibasis]|uniref:Uncharacterized protein n=1 Tax=Dictyostelium firmibasis TaxID=79012 RepID=A0AAN7U734_9MYCE